MKKHTIQYVKNRKQTQPLVNPDIKKSAMITVFKLENCTNLKTVIIADFVIYIFFDCLTSRLSYLMRCEGRT